MMVGAGFAERLGRMVGRSAEVERLKRYLHERGTKRYVYYWAEGGLGKTRLLEELVRMVADAGPGFLCSGIIDLYHTDLHSTSRIEQTIVNGLDPKGKRFSEYRRLRREYELLREWGADPDVLEERRAALSAAFVHGCRDLALDARLVICFDTVELLQYESSAVERMAGLDAMDARIKPWLLRHLAELGNVLVVLAGRPRRAADGEERDLQAAFEEDLEAAFGKENLEVVELEPLDEADTRAFISALTPEIEGPFLSDSQLAVVHLLTGGRPILLHLTVDLLTRLSPEPRRILEMFDRHASLVGTPLDSDAVAKARSEIERELVQAVFAEGGVLEDYMRHIALIPKGVNAAILRCTRGMPDREARELLDRLKPLSITKLHAPPPGEGVTADERLFLHDEMYRLLRLPGVVPNLEATEREVARKLKDECYASLIEDVEDQIASSRPEARAPFHERLHRLQVERLYYELVCDVKKGYEEYRQLSDEANRERRVGFSMRLLDEFLRFYNDEARRDRFERTGLTHERILRDSVLMWVERLYHWGQRRQAIEFARQVLDSPEQVYLDEKEHLDILANICALWANAYPVVYGYDQKVIDQAEEMLERLPPLEACSLPQALARARLGMAIGYGLDQAGMLSREVQHYVESLAAFRKEGQHQEEYVRLLNNLAYVHALQGRFRQARIVAHEALRLGEGAGYEYTRGLTLSVLSSIARMRDNYARAIEYGQEALELFNRVNDPHGILLARQASAKALRQQAQHETRMRRKPEEARKQLEAAETHLRAARRVLSTAGLGAQRYAGIYAELGRLERDLGDWHAWQKDGAQATAHRQKAQKLLKQAVEDLRSFVERADTLHDLAEVQCAMGDVDAALKTLNQAEALIRSQHAFDSGQFPLPPDMPSEYLAPLGKVQWQRGRIALGNGEVDEAARHILLAYAYLRRFSEDAIQLEQLVDDVHAYLRSMPKARASFMASIERIAAEAKWVEVTPFVQTLRELP